MNKIILSLCVLFGLQSGVFAQNCKILHRYEGLVFDAAAQSLDIDMEHYLDRAVLSGSEKIVLYAGLNGPAPSDLQELFPDQVLDGADPWSGADPVYWQNLAHDEDLQAFLNLARQNPSQRYLLTNPMRFDVVDYGNWLQNLPNLWLGYGPQEIQHLKKNCATGVWADLIDQSKGRVVFTSIGEEKTWKFYNWLIRDLKKTASYLPVKTASALIYQNAENLYDLAVNAP